MNNEIKSNSLVFAGPFLGEFGWEISHWMPHIRWLRKQYPGRYLTTASYPGRQALYNNIINEFWPLPEWFVDEKYDCDCFEALCEPEEYGKLINYFHNKCQGNGKFSNIIQTRTPRGFNHILRSSNQVLFDKLTASEKPNETYKTLMSEYGNKPCVIIFARDVHRKMFLDIVNNCPRSVSELSASGSFLPTRNWPRSHWQDLFEMLYNKYSDRITFVIGGLKESNCLTDMANKYNVINLADIGNLDLTIAFLNNALCCICSQSGPMHLSLHCKCPTFIYGHEEYRNAIEDNPLKTEVVHFTTELDKYNDSPELLFKDICVMIDDLIDRKSEDGDQRSAVRSQKKSQLIASAIRNPQSTIKDILKIGMVGVFDIKGSTNIPFGKAFASAGHEVNIFNYRTIASKIGYDAMNKEIVKFSADYDLIVFCKANGVMAETIKACGQYATTCWWMMDAIDHLEADPNYFKMATVSDISIVSTKAVQDLLITNGIQNVYHIIQGIDPKEFHPINTEKIYDIVFIGQKTKKRDYIINIIKSWGYKIKAFGHGYDSIVIGDEFNKACCSAKICLNINNTSLNIDSFSDRIIRYMATRSCVLTEYSKGLEKYFDISEHLIWYYNDMDLKDELKRLMDDEDLRSKIADAGYQRIIKKHTWDKVVEQILNISERGSIL
jgi:spore maturation protein CgeB